MYNLSKRSKENLKGVHPLLADVIENAIHNTPVDFTVVCGVRTTEEQQALYAQGRTSRGQIVTNCDGVKKKSNHQPKEDGYSYAVDIYPFFEGKVQVNHKNTIRSLMEIALHIKTCCFAMGVSIEWGGDWAMKDFPHFELKV